MTIEILEDKVLFNLKGCEMLEMAVICGALQQFMGAAAIRGGKSLEDVKDNMLDIHLAAMDMLTEQVIRERSGNDGGKEEMPDTKGEKV